MKDLQIVELLKNRNYSKASEKLYRYYPVVKKLIIRNSGTSEDAEDIYQEALIILIRKVTSTEFELTSSLDTYLYSICRFLWSEQLRKKSKTITVEFDAEKATVLLSDLETLHKTELETKMAENAFQLLGQKCKQLLQLFYVKKMAFKEIAIKMDYHTEKVAKNQKYRCLEKAKDNLRLLKSNSHE